MKYYSPEEKIESNQRQPIKQFLLIPVILFIFSSCANIQPIQFRAIKNITVDADSSGNPLLKGEAVFYNPNKLRMKLKEIKMEVSLEGKKAATVDQKPSLKIGKESEFVAKIEAHLSLKEIGLLDTFLSLFGGKNYNVQYVGYVRVRVHGVTVKVPVNYQSQIKLKL